MGFANASLLLKINFILLILTVIIQILGLALPYWIDIDSSDSNSGLWQSCSGGNCQSITSLGKYCNFIFSIFVVTFSVWSKYLYIKENDSRIFAHFLHFV